MKHAKSCPRSVDTKSPCTCGGMDPVPPGLTVDGPASSVHKGGCQYMLHADRPCTCGASGGVVDGVMVKAVIFHITEPGVFALRYPNADHSGMWLERVDNKPGSATDENAATTEVRK